jgi:hypothetical protein
MRGKKEPIHRLPGVCRDDALELDLAAAMNALMQNGREFLDRVFVTESI